MAFMVKGRLVATGEPVTRRMLVGSAHEAATQAAMAGIEVTSVYQCEDAPAPESADGGGIAWEEVAEARPRRHTNMGLWIALGGALLVLLLGAAVTLVVVFGRHGSSSGPPSTVPPESAGLARAKRLATIATMGQLKNAVHAFEIDNGRYPSTREGLDALIHCPPMSDPQSWHKVIDDLPVDGWGNAFQYKGPEDVSNNRDFDIISAGPDKKLGTSDDLNLDSQ